MCKCLENTAQPVTADLAIARDQKNKFCLPQIIYILKGRFARTFLEWFLDVNLTAFKKTSAVAKNNK